jgi:hypothetical protein
VTASGFAGIKWPSRRANGGIAYGDKEGRVLEVFDGVAVSIRGDAFVALWNAPSRVPRIRWGFDLMKGQIARCPEGIVALFVLLPDAHPPDGPARAENAMQIREVMHAVRATSTVIPGYGLMQTITRTVVRTMLLVTPKTHRTTISATLSEGLARMMDVATPATPSIAQTREDIGSLYAALGLARPVLDAATF